MEKQRIDIYIPEKEILNSKVQAEFDYYKTISQPRVVKSAPLGYLFLKRLADITISGISLVVLSPLLLFLAICVRTTSKGPAIFRQTRVGKKQKAFVIYKFRTMLSGADDLKTSLTAAQYAQFVKERKLSNDPRITPFGAFLRRTSLDELPQLLNILKGEMSFVGPRPIVNEEIEKYQDKLYAYLGVKPGLTGMWQVNGRSTTTYDERINLDVFYYNNRSLSLDIQLLFSTFKVVFSKKGAC